MDRLTKMSHFTPLKPGIPTKELARILLQNFWRVHGRTEEIVSERDSRLEGKLWSSLLVLLGVDPWMSTTYHPQTDGQTERVNQTWEQDLRNKCSYQPDDGLTSCTLLSTRTIRPPRNPQRCHRCTPTMATSQTWLGRPQNARWIT